MSLEDTLRAIVREEIRAAVAELKTAAPGNDADPLLTPREAAAAAKVDYGTIAKWKARGKIKVVGESRRWRVRASELFKAAK